MAKTQIDKDGNERIQCRECDGWFHRLDVHLKVHTMDVKRYNRKHPSALTISQYAIDNARKAQGAAVAKLAGQAPKPALAFAPKPAADNTKIFKIGVARLTMRDNLNEADAARVPKHDDYWTPGKVELAQWELLGVGIQTKTPVFIFGPTGCGKTSGAKELAAALNQPVRRVQMNKDWEYEAFVGCKELVQTPEGNTITTFEDGVLTEAIRKGYWFLLDEMDAAPPDILLALQGVLEDGVLVLPTGEVVEPHPDFRLIATGNTNGRGDDTGLYAGTHVLNEATLDRFGVVIKADYPDTPTSIKILVDRTGIDIGKARKMQECAVKVREALANDACSCTFSLRRLIRWAELTVLLGDTRRAAEAAVTNKLSGDDEKFVNGLIQRYFGGEV